MNDEAIDEKANADISRSDERPKSRGTLGSQWDPSRRRKMPERVIELGTFGPVKLTLKVPKNARYTDEQIAAMRERFAEGMKEKVQKYLEKAEISDLQFPNSRGPIHEIVARNIRSLRSVLGMSQKDLATKLGIPPQDLCRIEQAQRLPRGPLLEKIANALGTNTATLIRDATDDAQGK